MVSGPATEEDILSTKSINLIAPYAIVGTPNVEYRAEFEWHPADPTTVRATFAWSPEESVDWVFSRELLADGITSFMWLGDGDVKFRSYSVHQFCIRLSSPEGTATLLLATRQVEDFLRETESVVGSGSPDEQERVQVWMGLALEKLLDGSE
jgi:hypothetical protein